MTLAKKFLGSSLPFVIFAAVTAFAFRFQDGFFYIFPFYSLIFMLYSFRSEKETQYILLFVISAVGFIFPRFSQELSSPREAVAVYSEIFVLWIYVYVLNYAAKKKTAEFRTALGELSRDSEILKNLESEVRRYAGHKASLTNRIRFHAELSDAVKDITSSPGADEIRDKMKALLKKHFPGRRIELNAGYPANDFEKWVLERNSALLVKNAFFEKRFPRSIFPPEADSVMTAALQLMGSPIGFVSVYSKGADSLKNDDLITLELITNICSVAMENINLFKKVKSLAIKDSLTGLYTHGFFKDRLEEEILRSARTRIPFSLIMLDIDHFKNYNDTWGHQAGDEVLKSVAKELTSSVREVDFAARYGGEEFAVILAAAGKSDAAEMAEYLREKISSLRFDFGGGAGVTASFGVAEFPLDAAISSQVIRAADERLYRAKKNGRNRVEYE